MAELNVKHEEIHMPEDASLWMCPCGSTAFELYENNWIVCDECDRVQNDIEAKHIPGRGPEWGKQYHDNE